MLNIGTISAVLKLTDNLTPALIRAQASLRNTGAGMRRFGASMRAAGTSMTMGLTAPIVGGVAAAAVAFGGFEKSMNRVKALSGATGADFEALTAQAKDLGNTTSFSAGEAADAMGFLAMAGFSAQETLSAMPGVLELAASAQLDLASAADITSNIMTGYGKSTEDLAHVNNVLVRSMTTANVDLTMLGESMKYVAPVAAAAGVSFESATASIALMGNAGIQGSMAGTALRGAITKLLNPTKKAATEMDALGLSATDAQGNLLPMSDIVQQLGDKSATTSQLMTIFGLRAGPAMAGLVSQGHEALREMTADLEGVGNIAQEITEIQMQGLAGAFTRFQSATSGAMIEIGEQLAPALESFLELGIRLANWISTTLVPAFTALSPTTQKWILGIVAVVAALGPLLVIAGMVVSAIGVLAGAVAGITAGMAIGFVAAIVAVVAAFGGWKLWKWTQDAQIFGRALDYVKNILGFLSDEEYAAATAARKLNTDLGDVTPTADELRNALGVAGVEGTVAELQQAMVNLAGVAGRLAEDEMSVIAQRAIQLRKDGEDLTPELARIVEQFERQQVAAREAAVALAEEEAATVAAQHAAEAAAVALAAQEEATAKLREETEDLRAELAGDGLLGELDMLQDAWGQLTPAQQENAHVMERAATRARALAAEGVILSEELQKVVEASDAAGASIETTGTKMSATERAAQRLADQFSGRNLRGKVEELEAALVLLGGPDGMAPITRDAFLQLGEAALTLREEGGHLTDELDAAADFFRNAESAANDFVGPLQEVATNAEDAEDAIGGLGSVLRGIAGDMNRVFTAAFEGGGAALGALRSMATNAAEGFLAMIPVVGPFLAQFAGPIIAGIGRIGSAIRGLFGRSTIENLSLTASRMWGIVLTDVAAQEAARMAEEVGDDFAGLLLSLGTVIDEAGGVMALGFETVTSAARDMFSAIDMGKLDAEQALTGLLPVLEAMAGELEHVDAAGREAFLELIRLADEFGLDMTEIARVVGQDLVDEALGNWEDQNAALIEQMIALGDGLHEVDIDGVVPLMANLVELGVITEDQKLQFEEMLGLAIFDTKRAEEAAKRWGIELSQLGPQYRSAKIGEEARSIAEDFDILLASGMDVNDIIDAQGHSIHAVVRDARWAGTEIPEAMRPAIQAWIDQGGAVDENGEAITDISQIDFATPIEDRLADVLTSLGTLIQRFIDALTPIDNMTTEIEDIPDIEPEFIVPEIPPIVIPAVEIPMAWGDPGSLEVGGMGGGAGGGAGLGFQHGTGGKFLDFGAGTPVTLHGRERVTTLSEGRQEVASMRGVEQRLTSIERLLRDQPRAFGLAVSDSITLAR